MRTEEGIEMAKVSETLVQTLIAAGRSRRI